jgi:hypothetical protein
MLRIWGSDVERWKRVLRLGLRRRQGGRQQEVDGWGKEMGKNRSLWEDSRDS